MEDPSDKKVFLNELTEVLERIEGHCKLFDEGRESAAKDMSVCLGSLFYDNSHQESLLKKLKVKEKIKLLSTNKKYTKRLHLGLVRKINVGVNDGVGGEAKYWALCDERYFPMPEDDNKSLTVKEWFDEKVFSSKEYNLTRSDIMRDMRNKDGGAHVNDPSVGYKKFKEKESGGSCLVGIRSGKARGYDNAPLMPSMRQMCYEVLKSDIRHQVNSELMCDLT